jgi:hypothetical protein
MAWAVLEGTGRAMENARKSRQLDVEIEVAPATEPEETKDE